MTEPSDESALTAWHRNRGRLVRSVAAVLMGAVEQARAAITEFSGEDTLGEYLGASFEDPNAATHRFLADMPGYQGWQWAVVVATCPGASQATISEVVLVPGPTALLAPEWVPWQDRVKAGDLGPGRSAGAARRRPRLVPGYTASGDPQVDEVAVEVGLGRRQVLGEFGRSDAAQRWHDGDFGPDRRWRGRPAGCAATAASTFPWPGSWARCSGCAPTSWPPTGMSSSPNTVAAHTRTPRTGGYRLPAL